MKRICFVTTSPLIVNFFLAPHLVYLAGRHEVTLIVNTGEGVPLVPLPGVEVVTLELRRRWSPLADLKAVLGLVVLFRRRHFDLVHSFSPKAGLLAMLAAMLAGVQRRVHTFTGQIWATGRGPRQAFFKAADYCIARCATHVLADSPSQGEFLIAQGVVAPGRCTVLGLGSVNGVDTQRFRPDGETRSAIRAELGIPQAAIVVLFLGRMKVEKGIPELARAFAALAGRYDHAHLLLVGPDEEGLWPAVEQTCAAYAVRLHTVDYTFAPERYVAAADILALPSHREGFGSVVIEAAAAAVPAVASRIYGVSDAVVDGETGLLHEAGDAQDLARQLERLLTDADLRARLGVQARERVLRSFEQARMTQLLDQFYDEILA
jgi:glycosyltransferase involved in cell wall biosynthesis